MAWSDDIPRGRISGMAPTCHYETGQGREK
jgi:hypothetical protein